MRHTLRFAPFLVLLSLSLNLSAQQVFPHPGASPQLTTTPYQPAARQTQPAVPTHDHSAFEGVDVTRCYTTEADSALRAQHPNLGSLDDFEAWMARAAAQLPGSRAVVTLPVVIHILHDGTPVGTGFNLDAARIYSQIDVLNEDFRRLNADAANTPGDFLPVAADAEVEFCPAVLNPSNVVMTELGINRIDKVAAGWGSGPVSQTLVENTIKAATQWDPTLYFNIWVVPMSGGILGYAQFPTGSGLSGLTGGITTANTDGIVVTTEAFGRTNNPNAPYNLGRTTTHEVGHFLGLRHIWGDGGCGADDFCADTPRAGAANTVGSPCTYPGPNSCNTGGGDLPDMFQNYMDYTDDVCMNLFTANQKTRMVTVLANSPRRLSLTTSDRCTAPSPYLTFGPVGTSPDEASTAGTACDRFQDLTLSVSVLAAPTTGPALVTVNVAGGTATLGADFSFPAGNTLSFPVGSNASQSLTLRVLDDAVIEGPETLTLSLTITNPGGTDVTLSPTYTDLTLTILDDDRDPQDATEVFLFSEDFEGALTGWSGGVFNVGSANTWTVNTTAPLSGSRGAHVAINGTGAPAYGATTSHSFIRTPLIDASATNGSLELEFLFEVEGELFFGTYYDYGQLLYSFDGSNYFVFIDEIQGFDPGPFIATVDLPAELEGQQFYLAFGWVNDNSVQNNPPFTIDDIVVRRPNTLQVAETLNASRTAYLGPNVDAYFYDETTGDLICRIENLSAYDYGCTEVTVDRAGTGATTFWNDGATTNAYDLADKTVRVIPEFNNPNPGDSYRITVYYTAAEVAGWSGVTTRTWPQVQMVKSPGAIGNVNPTSPFPNGNILIDSLTGNGTLGFDYFVSGTFANGFSGFGAGRPGPPPVAFPIEFLAFEAEAEGRDAALNWTYTTDLDVDRFVVERSTDGIHFEAAGELRPAPDTHDGNLDFTDQRIAQHQRPVLYYRVRGIDIAGQHFLTEVRSLPVPFASFRAQAYPVPFERHLTVEIEVDQAQDVTVELHDLAGRHLRSTRLSLAKGLHPYTWDLAGLSQGMYLLRVSTPQATVVQPVTKQ